MRAPDRRPGSHGGQKNPTATLKFARLFGSLEQVEGDPSAADTDERRQENEPQIVLREDAGKNAHAKIPTIAIRVSGSFQCGQLRLISTLLLSRVNTENQVKILCVKLQFLQPSALCPLYIFFTKYWILRIFFVSNGEFIASDFHPPFALCTDILRILGKFALNIGSIIEKLSLMRI
jgi:hypothetical protein